MTLQIDHVRYGSADQYIAYAARPARAKLPLPAVIVLQEAWGVDDHIEHVTRRFAEAGYVAFAPDVFAVNGARPELLTRDRLAEVLAFVNDVGPASFDPTQRDALLAKKPEDARARITATMGKLMEGLGPNAMEKYVPQLTATSAFLRDRYEPARGQKVAAIGFCLGGGLAGMLACFDEKLAGAIAFYGSPPPSELAAKIACPVLGIYGDATMDTRIAGLVPAFEEAMKKAGKSFERHFYAGAGHAFFNDERPSYEVKASRDSFVRSLAFLEKVLA